MNVLIVDDSAMLRVMLKRILIQLGVRDHQIYEAENGQTGLERLSTFHCEAIITDWRMPVMDCLAFVKQVRQSSPQIPIVMITAANERDQVVEAVKSGVNDYLVKPFNPADARKKLTNLLRRAQQSTDRNMKGGCLV